MNPPPPKQPLHDHDVGVALAVFGLGQGLIAGLTADAERLGILDPDILDPADLVECIPRKAVAILRFFGAALHGGNEKMCNTRAVG